MFCKNRALRWKWASGASAVIRLLLMCFVHMQRAARIKTIAAPGTLEKREDGRTSSCNLLLQRSLSPRGNGGKPVTYSNSTREAMFYFTLVADVSVARSSYAKDYEHISSGRSPGFWLLTLLILPSHPISESGLISLTKEDESLTSYSSA